MHFHIFHQNVFIKKRIPVNVNNCHKKNIKNEQNDLDVKCWRLERVEYAQFTKSNV